MAYKYDYTFVEHGKTRDSGNSINNEIWLDVGNKIELGTFDHHGYQENFNSTVDILMKKIDLMDETRKELDSESPVRIFLHRNPDTDALFATFLLQFFFDNGKDEFCNRFVNTKLGTIITSYVNDIDCGKEKVVDVATLYALICNIDIEPVREKIGIVNTYDLFNKEVEIALGWIRRIVDIEEQYIEEGCWFNLYKWQYPDCLNDEIASIINETIVVEANNCYERDKIENRVVIENIKIWTKEGNVEDVKAAIWNDVPTSPSTSYQLARNEGAVLTFVPSIDDGKKSAIVAINRDIDGYEKYSLREVAEMYEQLEQIYDRNFYERTGVLNRDYSKPRGDGKSSVFTQKPFAMTNDPWFVSAEYDIVDSPGKKGSLIPFEEMIEVLKNITKMVRQTYVVNYDLSIESGGIKYDVSKKFNDAVSLTKLTETIGGDIKNTQNSEYPLVLVEVDSSLISHNYNILDAYFMNLSDGGYIDKTEAEVFRIDYRTHLYVNQASSVLFVATSDVQDDRKSLNGMLDWTSVISIKNSEFINLFSQVLYQRESFKSIGRFIGDFQNKKRRELTRENEELIRLLAKAQANECIDSQLESDIYDFIYRVLRVDVLKADVKESMSLVSEHTKDTVYGNLDKLSLVTIPFIIISTLFQIGFLRFATIVNFENETALVWKIGPWIVLVVVTVIFTVWVRKKK